MAVNTRLTKLWRLPPKLIKQYHSYDHPSPSGPFNSTEAAILSAATAHIRFHGFTLTSLTLGAKDCDYLDVSTNLFPRGAFDLVYFHLFTQRQALSQHHDILESGHYTGTASKVKALTWARLMSNRDIIHRLQEALALMAKPPNISASLWELHSLSDEIWFLSGDVSVDTSWYTKRASLSTIYASTELFMTTDKSSDFKDTKDFLDRRFEDTFKLGRFAGGLGQWIGFTGSAAINVMRSKGVRI